MLLYPPWVRPATSMKALDIRASHSQSLEAAMTNSLAVRVSRRHISARSSRSPDPAFSPQQHAARTATTNDHGGPSNHSYRVRYELWLDNGYGVRLLLYPRLLRDFPPLTRLTATSTRSSRLNQRPAKPSLTPSRNARVRSDRCASPYTHAAPARPPFLHRHRASALRSHLARPRCATRARSAAMGIMSLLRFSRSVGCGVSVGRIGCRGRDAS